MNNCYKNLRRELDDTIPACSTYYASNLSVLHAKINEIIQKTNNKDEKNDKGEENNVYYNAWFRGHRDSSYKLTPTIYRKFTDNNKNFAFNGSYWDGVEQYEKKLLTRFRCEAFHKIDNNFTKNDYMMFSVMQHYGASTRLLDFTESLQIAIFFALEKFIENPSIKIDGLPCLWVFFPKLFKHGYDQTGNIKIERLNIIEPGDITNNDKKFILANVPYHTERIQAQQGCFVIFPKIPADKKDDMEKYNLEVQKESPKYLSKIILTDPITISKQLKSQGIKRSLYYPELEAICKEIDREEFKY